MIHSRRIAWQQRTVNWVLAALLLAYAGLFQHHIEHPLGTEDSHCAQCLAANHFGDAPPASLPGLLDVSHCAAIPFLSTDRTVAVPFPYFSARAPPSHSLV